MSEETILIVDDDQPLRELYRERLTLAGYKVDEAAEGQEALNKVQQNPHYAAILLDILMPKISGMDVLTKLKSLSGAQNIPVLMFTALGKGANEARAREAKADAYLTKAEVTPRDVVKKLEETIKRSKNK